MGRKIATALRAGVTAYAISVLLAALPAAPLLAGDDFAHSHPEGVTAHVHPITQLLPGSGDVAPQHTALIWIVLLTLTIAVVGLNGRRPEGQIRSRAPPAPG